MNHNVKSGCVYRLWVALIVSLIGIGHAHGALPDKERTLLDADLEMLLKSTADLPELAGVALAVQVGDDLVYIGAAGCAEIKEKINTKTVCRRSMKPGTKVRVASISKMALAMGITSMVEEGLINLDEDVSTYLGWPLRNPDFPDHPITVRQLLSHTSSIRDPAQYWVPAPQKFETFFSNEGLPFAVQGKDSFYAPGDYFSYANLNSGILASVMEKVSEERFDLLMTKRVFEPLKLEVGYNWSGVSRKTKRQGGVLYRKKDKHWAAQIDDASIRHEQIPYFLIEPELEKESYLKSYRPGDNASLFSPQGGLRASVRDLLVLTTAMRKNKLMQVPIWQINENNSNGDSERNFFAAYDLGTQKIQGTDKFLPGITLRGHPGEAYGLYSGTWTVIDNAQDPEALPVTFSFVVTGVGKIPGQGVHPSFNEVEEQLVRLAFRAVTLNENISVKEEKHSHNDHHGQEEPRPYDQSRNAMADVDLVLARAVQSRKKPLLILGANWCHDSRGLAARFEEPEFATLINQHYELLYVDVGRRDRNLEVAKRFGVHSLIGTPTVLILSPEGKLLNGDSVHRWKTAASISKEETYTYFQYYAKDDR